MYALTVSYSRSPGGLLSELDRCRIAILFGPPRGRNRISVKVRWARFHHLHLGPLDTDDRIGVQTTIRAGIAIKPETLSTCKLSIPTPYRAFILRYKLPGESARAPSLEHQSTHGMYNDSSFRSAGSIFDDKLHS